LLQKNNYGSEDDIFSIVFIRKGIPLRRVEKNYKMYS